MYGTYITYESLQIKEQKGYNADTQGQSQNLEI
jgi:hypothetical protein